MNETFDFAFHAKARPLLLWQRADRKYRHRTNFHTVGLTFAAIAIDHRVKYAGLLFAFCGIGQRMYSMD